MKNTKVSDDLYKYLDSEHPQNVFKCSICGRLHEAKTSTEESTFLIMVGGFLANRWNFPELKEFQPFDQNGKPNLLIICKRFGCLLRLIFSLLHLK